MNILITGASKGIGRAVSLTFCRKGDHNLYLVSRNQILLGEVKSQCFELNPGTNVFEFPYDIGNPLDMNQLAQDILSISPTLDILINNAGSLVNKPFGVISDSEISYMFNVNFFAPAMLTRLLIPSLLKAKNAHVINIGSMGGYQGSSKYPGLSYYSASKGALGILTECLAIEYKDSGISFNCLALGAVQTEMFTDAFPGAKANVNPEEMAEYIVNFSLTANPVINGKIIPVIIEGPL